MQQSQHLNDFKKLASAWDGTKCKSSMCKYNYYDYVHSLISGSISGNRRIHATCLFCINFRQCTLMYVLFLFLNCVIFVMLAFKSSCFIFPHTDENKVYLILSYLLWKVLMHTFLTCYINKMHFIDDPFYS